jgi:hypothetical protein
MLLLNKKPLKIYQYDWCLHKMSFGHKDGPNCCLIFNVERYVVNLGKLGGSE